MSSEPVEQQDSRPCDCGTPKEALIWCYIHGCKIKPPVVRQKTQRVIPASADALAKPTTRKNNSAKAPAQEASPAEALEEHTSAPSANRPEPVEPARAPEPSSPSEPTPRIARSPVGDGTASEHLDNGQSEGQTATDNDFEPSSTTTEISELQGTKNHEEGTCVVEAMEDEIAPITQDLPLSVAPRRYSPWSRYARPEPNASPAATEPYAAPTEPLPPRARLSRKEPVHKAVTIPSYVKEAKIAEQGGRCCYCERRLGTPVLHDGQVEILSPHAEHFKPRAASGRTTDANIAYACHVCNLLKSDFVFDTVEAVIEFLRREWKRKRYEDCPPVVPYQIDQRLQARLSIQN